MELIILVCFLIFALYIANRFEQEARKKAVSAFTNKCPPHQWEWQDLNDLHGNKVGERIVCKKCGPLKTSSLEG